MGPGRLGRRPGAEGRDRESESAGPEAGAEGRDQESRRIEVAMGGDTGAKTGWCGRGRKYWQMEARLGMRGGSCRALLVRIRNSMVPKICC